MSNFYISGNGSISGNGNLVSSIGYINPTINNYIIPVQSYFGSYTLTPVSNSPSPLYYSVNGSSIATTSGGILYYNDVGTVNVTINQSAINPYNSASVNTYLYITGYYYPFSKFYGTNSSLNGNVNCSILDSSNNIVYFGGNFTTFGSSQSVNNIFAYDVNLNTVTALGTTTYNGTNGNVNALSLDGSMNLYVGGNFVNTYDSINTSGIVANNVAMWNITTSTWSLLGNVLGYGVSGGIVSSLAYDTSNTLLYVGGNISSYNGTALLANNISKWDPVSGTWSVLGNVTGNGTDQTTFINSLVNITAQSGLNNYALNHLKITGSLTNVWGPMASSHDGKYLLITNGGNNSGYAGVGYMYISSNYGVSGSWSPIFTDALRSWITVCVSYTGQYQYAVASYGATVPLYPSAVVNTLIYKSSNYGVDGSWYSLNSNILAGWNLSKMAISANGQYLICISPSPSGTGVYLSTDYGTNFTIVYSNMVTPSNRACLAMSATGNYMTYAEPTNGISISTNYGSSGSWIKVFTPSPTATYPNNQGPSNTTMSSNGQYMYAGMNQNLNNILKSTNYGASGSWYFSSVVLTGYGPGDPNALAASSSGKIIVLGTFAGSNLYISTNYGVLGSFFSIISSSNYFLNVAISPNEQYIYASTYTYSNSNNGNVYMLNIGTPGVRSMTLDNSKNLYVGGTFTGYYNNSATITGANGIVKYFPATNSWTNINPGAATSGVQGNVNALSYDSSNSIMYVGGNFSGVTNNSTTSAYLNIAKWTVNTNTWSPMGSSTSNGILGTVNAIQVDLSNSKTYVGGYITTVYDAAPVSHVVNNFTVWDNSTNLWYPVGNTKSNGTVGYVNSLSLNKAKYTLYVGGNISQVTDAYSSYSVSGIAMMSLTYYYTISSYTSSTSATITGSRNIYYVIIGGGGSGGAPSNSALHGGGGGAGAIISGFISQSSTTTYTITVGGGGEIAGSNTSGNGGSSSSISYGTPTTTITASGGYGSITTTGGLSGGTTKGLTGVPGVTESGSSSAGGNAAISVTTIIGYKLTINNPPYTRLFASGGGGGESRASVPPYTNAYGGGQGGSNSINIAVSGVANTGSGGGGERGSSGTINNASGGSGIVLIFF